MSIPLCRPLPSSTAPMVSTFTAPWQLEIVPTSTAAAAPLSPADRTIASPASTVSTANVPTPKDRKSTRLNSSHSQISYAVFCLEIKLQSRTDLAGRLLIVLIIALHEDSPQLV